MARPSAIPSGTSSAELDTSSRAPELNDVTSFHALEKDCAAGELRSCAGLGNDFLNGIGTAPDDLAARAAFEKSCNAKEHLGCTGLGTMMILGQGGPGEKEEGTKLLLRSCDENEGGACTNLGLFARQGTIADPEGKTLTWDEKGCGLDAAGGCFEVGMVYQMGLAGTAIDNSKARVAYEKSCRLKNGAACFMIGIMNGRAIGGPFDWERAKAAFEESCRLGWEDGCERAKTMKR